MFTIFKAKLVDLIAHALKTKVRDAFLNGYASKIHGMIQGAPAEPRGTKMPKVLLESCQGSSLDDKVGPKVP